MSASRLFRFDLNFRLKANSHSIFSFLAFLLHKSNEMANSNETIKVEPSQGTDRRIQLAIALSKQIQTKAANLAKVLQTYEQEHQLQPNIEPKLEEEELVEETEEKQSNRIAMKYKDRFSEMQLEVKALKLELSEKNSKLSAAINKGIQAKSLAKKYKDSFFNLKSKLDQSETIDHHAEKYNYMRNLYEQNLLEENRARIVALTETDPQMSSRFEVAEVVMHWKELDTKMQQIIDENAKSTSDGVQENGHKRSRDSEGEDSNNKKVAC